MISVTFSAFKSSSLVIFPTKTTMPMMIRTKSDISYFNFLLAHTASSPGGQAPLWRFSLI